MYQILNVSVITVSDSKKGNRIILDRKTLFHSSVKSNMACRVLKTLSQTTKRYERKNDKY